MSIYFTAGFPGLNDTHTILDSLQKFGADMIEIGMPYSDPLADGPVIQHSSMVSLQNGFTIKWLFRQLHLSRRNLHLPLILMGYLNPVLQFGIENFCIEAHKAGIDGIILPDLPLTVYETEYRPLFEKYGLHVVFLVTPETSDERIRKMDAISTGFIYAVSSSSITGVEKNIAAQENYFRRLKALHLKNPILIGFGIRDNSSFLSACRYAMGAIIGTAYIKSIENSGNIEQGTKKFLNSILEPEPV